MLRLAHHEHAGSNHISDFLRFASGQDDADGRVSIFQMAIDPPLTLKSGTECRVKICPASAIIDLIPQPSPLYGFILDDGTGKLVKMLTAFHAGRAV
jgi:hypothetical protein